MISVDGRPVESIRMTHAFGTHWTARVTCETYAPGELATISDGETDWVGRILPTHTVELGASVTLTVTGGGADWDTEIAPRHWLAAVSVGDVAAQLATAVGGTAEPAPAMLPQWRHRAATLGQALASLARWTALPWYLTPGGAVAFAAPAGEALSEPVDSDAETLTYDVGPRLPLVLSATVSRALYLNGAITIWPKRAALTLKSNDWAGAEVEAQDESTGRVDLILDDGSKRCDLPLWSSPGVAAIVPVGTRVLVLDVGGDPRATIAFASPWGAPCDELRLGGALIGEGGTALREGDWVLMPFGAAGTPTPTKLELAPPSVGPPAGPGSGPSRVKL